jgi:lipase chaperone LimK
MKRFIVTFFIVCLACDAPKLSATTETDQSTQTGRALASDGELRFAADGTLIPGPEAVRFFDFHLKDRDRESAASIRARVPSAAQPLFDRYLDYLDRARAIRVEIGTDVEAGVARVRQLRRDVFGEATATVLFADAERFLDFALASRRVLLDPSLDDAARSQRLVDLEATLLPIERARREAARAPLLGHGEIEAMRSEGASADEIHRARVARFGADAADRLAALDQRRAAWSARFLVYQTERDAMMSTAMAPSARTSALETLRARHFQAPELPRVRALDRIDGIE